jgi:hydroxymethylpyrimidine/phosphomethylpyrimidine kinase
VRPELVSATLTELIADVDVAAVHIGMLASAPVVAAVVEFLESNQLENVVLDPILRSSSGKDLLDPAGRKLLKQKLIPLCTALTPNVDEAAVLTGLPVTDQDQMRAAAHALHKQGAGAVVITGGHLEKAIDLLSFTTRRGIEQEVFKSDRQKSNSTHGTGCAFATAMACHLALGRGLPEAVLLAKAYVQAAIANAHPLGKGVGPVHHLYRMHETRRAAAATVRETESVN